MQPASATAPQAVPRASGTGLRALLLAADVGESHLTMARIIARDLESREDVAAATVIEDFSSLGPRLARVVGGGFRLHVGRVQWSYELAYRVFTGLGAAQRLGEMALHRLGGPALSQTVRRHRPDVVISTHPVLNAVLARLRAAGELTVPAAGVVGPLGGLDFWVQPRLDLHLFLYAEALEDARADLHGAPAAVVRPLVREEFFAPCSREDARAALGIDPEGPVVLISGGGWGAGDLAGSIDACLAVPGVRVIAVVGRNAELERELAARHGDGGRVQVVGFTDRMRDLLWAADAFITATAGLSCLEARLCGCPLICYGFVIGHVRDNVRALARHGYARTARTAGELPDAVTAALAAGRGSPPVGGALPRAADLVAELAHAYPRAPATPAGR